MLNSLVRLTRSRMAALFSTAPMICEIFVGNPRDLYVQIDSVEEWSGEAIPLML